MGFRTLAIITLIIALLPHVPTLAAPGNVVTYAAGAKNARFTCVLALSDGTVLVAGYAEDLDWLPQETERIALAAPDIHNGLGSGSADHAAKRIGFLLHLNAELTKPLRVAYLPAGTAEDIRWVKATNVPGEPTGDLYISGTTRDTRENNGGYFIGKLDGNFVAAPPTKLQWTRNVYATGDHQNTWDVGGDGKVVFVVGEPFNFGWCAVQRLTADGADDVVPEWRNHRTRTGGEVTGPLKDTTDIAFSQVVFKTAGRVELRSWTQEEYDAVTPDGNGGTRKGTWPMDLFFKGPGDPKDPARTSSGPGYTGLSITRTFTQRIGGIAVDRRTNHMYIGFCVQCRQPDGKNDYEPAVIAYSETGAMQWWSRLHKESDGNSPAPQCVDALAIDYSQPADTGTVAVVARMFGNGPNNLWTGDSIAKAQNPDNPGHGFKDGFTGSESVQMQWLGKLRANEGTLMYATYIAEWPDNMQGTGRPSRTPLLDGWPDPNAGFAQLAHTGVREDVRLDSAGRVYLMGYGRRTLTTRNAYQKMLKPPADPTAPRPNEGVSAWNEFVRAYGPRLDTVAYSSLLTGLWDPVTGEGAANTVLTSLCPTKDGVLVVGYHKADKATDGPLGNPVPTANIPPWGTDRPLGETPLLARLVFGR